MQDKRIYFIANLGDFNKVSFGGGEVGNRRTLKLLKKIGYNVTPIKRYLFSNDKTVKGLVKLYISILINIVKILIFLLFKRRKNSLVHISGFYGSTIYYETIITLIVKCLGYKTIYELRGGGAEEFYYKGTKFYRNLFKIIIKKNNYLFSQGIENYKLINNIKPNKHLFYYPNVIENGFAPKIYPAKPNDQINIIYFGRIAPEKNIELIILVTEKLKKKYNNITLTILGNYSSKTKVYYENLKILISNLNLQHRINIVPPCNHDELKIHLKNKHLYLFPSNNPREGHSNALTEAMAWGLIPIAIDHGFNKSVINNDSLIIKELDVDHFYNKIVEIIESNSLHDLSKKIYQRVQDNYTEDILIKDLEKEYKSLFSLQYKKPKH